MPRSRGRKGSSGRKSKQPEPSDTDLGSDKLYFKIGEVSEIVGVPAYVLRYWETEFKAVKPQKSRSQQRVYRRRDVQMLLKIKHLLYQQKFTIAGARQQLQEAPASCAEAPPDSAYLAKQSFRRVRDAFEDLEAFIEADTAAAAADPAAYVRACGGAKGLFAGETPETAPQQPLLARPDR